MHRHNGPGDDAASGHLQILASRQLDLQGIIQKFFLHRVVKFLPTVVSEGGDIVENEAIVLGVEFSRSLRRTRAPSLARTVDELAECGVVGGFLLRPSTNERQQCTDYRQRYVQQPAPTLGILVDSSAHRFGHSVAPRNLGTIVCRGMSRPDAATVVPPK